MQYFFEKDHVCGRESETLTYVLEELRREDGENDFKENKTNAQDNIRDGEEETNHYVFSQGQRVSRSQSEGSSTNKRKIVGFEDFSYQRNERLLYSTVSMTNEGQ